MAERESMEFDVVIVGGGPAGLSAACRLLQLARESSREITVALLEKGSEIGAHILSGAVIEPKALDELFPNWLEEGAPLHTPVTEDQVYFLRSEQKAWKVPNWMIPKTMHNTGNYIISLGNLCRWLGSQAEALGVEIFPGFPASEVLYHEDGRIKGVLTGDMGRAKDGSEKPGFAAGIELHAKYTLFAEGSRGHLGKQLIQHFDLASGRDCQHYAIGLKEIWEVDSGKLESGLVLHGSGWPLSESKSSGGFFLYHMQPNLISIGLIIDLNYRNATLNTFQELQRFKLHPVISKYLQGGKRVSYGARAITKGGWNSLPKMVMPGGMLLGCDAGTLNFAKIKGSHTAMKSGMLAAETVFSALDKEPGPRDLNAFYDRLAESWLYPELLQSRNFGPALHKFGSYIGGGYNYIEQNWFQGKTPWTIRDKTQDYQQLISYSHCKKLHYPKPDGNLTFDLNSSVFLSNTNHEEDQPVHLTLADPEIPVSVNLENWNEPAQLFCPSGVYEIIDEPSKGKILQINAQNCLHCKTCDIKDPSQNITWVVPEGGGGPNYQGM